MILQKAMRMPTSKPLHAAVADHLPVAWIFLLSLGGCASVDLSVREPNPSVAKSVTPDLLPPKVAMPTPVAPTFPAGAATRRGGYHLDDGPDAQIPEGLLNTPDAEPSVEPFAKGPLKPYSIFEKTYIPITDQRPFVQRGRGSWYGKKFHGQRTASGEIYNMYKMTAAHPTLPIPSYVRVTNLRNGKQVIVRVNDRGPFHSERIIDLSYTAALKLGYINSGSSELEVERLLPEDIARLNAEKRASSAELALPAATLPDEMDAIARLAMSGSGAQVAAETAGFYLQFGAYTQISNAQAMLERLVNGWPAEMPTPNVVQSKGFYRLHSGPFATREEADLAARQLQSAAQIRAAVVQK